jgi:hypothetical protein
MIRLASVTLAMMLMATAAQAQQAFQPPSRDYPPQGPVDVRAAAMILGQIGLRYEACLIMLNDPVVAQLRIDREACRRLRDDVGTPPYGPPRQRPY